MGNVVKKFRSKSPGRPTVRLVVPNHLIPEDCNPNNHPNRTYASNRIKTTKYTAWSFVPKNLFEQFHRCANLYFVFIVLLNFIPQINAFGKEVAMLPVIFVLAVTAIKDGYEDYRRLVSDQKINHQYCRVYSRNPGISHTEKDEPLVSKKSERRYMRHDWRDVLVGDIIHLSCNEVIPADIVLLRSSDALGSCNVETMNLDGENNLKQRQVVEGLKQGDEFHPTLFTHTIECELPNLEIYKFNGAMLTTLNERIPISKNNVILRGCILRNTDYVEGIVVYAGHDTKAMLNNRGPRYKRSQLERQINYDVIWCVIILFLMCFFSSVGSGLFMNQFHHLHLIPFFPYEASYEFSPAYQGFIRFWTYIIIYQVVIPLSLYVTIELVKLGQVYLIQQDVHMYHAETDRTAECRALNITEDLGQIQYIFSDKTGTLTENKMIFRRCCINGIDYSHGGTGDSVSPLNSPSRICHLHVQDSECDVDGSYNRLSATPSFVTEIEEQFSPDPYLQRVVSGLRLEEVQVDVAVDKQTIWDFFLVLTLCNTVCVSMHGHVDKMDASGVVHEDPTPPPSSSSSTPGDDFRSMEFLRRLRDLGPGVGMALKKNTKRLKKFIQSPSLKPQRKASNGHEEDDNAGSYNDTSAEVTDTGDLTDTDMSVMSENTLKTKYEAESPDELALVKAACTYGCRLLKKTPSLGMIWLPSEGEVAVKILHILHFDPVRRLMSVIIRHPATQEVILYCKGADSAVIPNLKSWAAGDGLAEKVYEETEKSILMYAKEGLRTLCMAKRVISVTEYQSWLRLHHQAETALESREKLLYESACRIEHSFELLGVTGIEDRLQEGVPETIAALREAGIRVWVLTGDKQETALNVAHACSLLSFDHELMVLNSRSRAHTTSLIENKLAQMELRNPAAPMPTTEHGSPDLRRTASAAGTDYFREVALVIDGKTLSYALEEKLEEQFLKLVQNCSSVLCCRATPYQKAALVKLVRDKLKKSTLAIGDGANDVSMIQTADIGIGISGREGMQAVMASDFALARFRFLRRLLLVHGHWCYDRLARMTLHMFFKNTVIVMLLMWYQIYCGFSANNMIDEINLIFFNLLYTSLPPILFGIFEQDISSSTLMSKPWLYQQGPSKWVYKKHSYFIHILDAVWQSLAEFYIPYFAFLGSDVGLQEFAQVTLAACMFATLLSLCIETKHWNLPHFVGMLVSFVFFYIFNLVYGMVCPSCDMYDLYQKILVTPQYWLCTALATIIALAPRFIVRGLQGSLWPPPSIRAHLQEQHDKSPAHFATWSNNAPAADDFHIPHDNSRDVMVDFMSVNHDHSPDDGPISDGGGGRHNKAVVT